MQRNAIRTGALVVVTLAILVAVLIHLGDPGFFVPQKTYFIYFDNAAGVRPGAQILLAGRRVGEVSEVSSPVAVSNRPELKYESLVKIKVEKSARIYREVHVEMRQLTMLSDMVIDFSKGVPASGLAPDGAYFSGVREPGVSEAVPLILARIDPAVTKTTQALDALQKTAENLDRLTEQGADLPRSLAEIRKLGEHLNELAAPDGSLRQAAAHLETLTAPDGPLATTLHNAERLTGPDGPIATTFDHAEKVTRSLAKNRDLEKALLNARRASERLDRTVTEFSPRVQVIGRNLEQATDTIKRQPWRILWPGTKKYPEDKIQRSPQPQFRLTSAYK